MFPCVCPARESPVYLIEAQKPLLEMHSHLLQPRALPEVTEDRDLAGSLRENRGRECA